MLTLHSSLTLTRETGPACSIYLLERRKGCLKYEESFLNYCIVMLKLFGIFVRLIDVIITLCVCICASLYECVCVHANCSVLEYMMKSNVINCQHSLYAMMAVSGAQRAALWSYYGNRFRGAYHF